MSALLRALMAQKTGGGDKPNLAKITDITTPFDHLAGRNRTMVEGSTEMKKNGIYHITCDVVFNITEVGAKIDKMLLGGYGPWHGASAFGTFWDVGEIGKFDGQVDYTGEYFSPNPDRFCQIDCGGMKGTVRLYNLVITEA